MTRTEAIAWTSANSIWAMRRSQAQAAGVLELWAAAMDARWEDDEEVRSAPDALTAALAQLYPVAQPLAIGACARCGGSGFIQAYAHIHGGKCLAC